MTSLPTDAYLLSRLKVHGSRALPITPPNTHKPHFMHVLSRHCNRVIERQLTHFSAGTVQKGIVTCIPFPDRVRRRELRKGGIFKASGPLARTISKSSVCPAWFCLSACFSAIPHTWRAYCTSDRLWKLFAMLTQLLRQRFEIGISSCLWVLEHPGLLGLKLRILSLV